jgi:hypothetical protein
MNHELSKPNRWRRRAMIIFVAFLGLGGLFFVRHQSFSSKAATLRPGMTRQEVFAVMGQPDRLLKLGKKDLALFTPVPFVLHALIMTPGQVLKGNSGVSATSFPAYVEFEGDVAIRVLVEGREIHAGK